MKIKKILILLLAFTAKNISAQDVEFNHSGGLTYLLGVYNNTTEFIDETYGIGYPGVTYNPRLDFKLGREKSFSLTAYPTLCMNGSVSSRNGASGTFAFEIPVGAQLNFGNHSTSRSRADFGGFVMAGYTFGAYSSIGTIHSITGMVGAKFYLREQPLGVRLQYNLPLNLLKTQSLQLFGIGLLYNFE
jgi:hypothetical protein